MKLTKIQREILESAVASEAEHGVKKPIHVNTLGRSLANFSKSYSTYCTQMEKLIDAGLISRGIYEADGYAYVTDEGIALINDKVTQ